MTIKCCQVITQGSNSKVSDIIGIKLQCVTYMLHTHSFSERMRERKREMQIVHIDSEFILCIANRENKHTHTHTNKQANKDTNEDCVVLWLHKQSKALHDYKRVSSDDRA